MFAFVKGEVADLMEGIVIVENNGIGYEILVPSDVVSEVTIGMEVKLHTYFHVKEDAMTLFGFLSREDLNIFKKLITVNSVGPKSALAIMSTLTTSDLITAIISGDSKAISKAPGVGSKSAQKIILELKDKFDTEDNRWVEIWNDVFMQYYKDENGNIRNCCRIFRWKQPEFSW